MQSAGDTYTEYQHLGFSVFALCEQHRAVEWQMLNYETQSQKGTLGAAAHPPPSSSPWKRDDFRPILCADGK